MQLRLYLDEDASSRSLVRGLRARGLDVLTAIQAGKLQTDDPSQLEFASQNGRVLYTYNVSDFYHLHTAWAAQGKSHAGIILVAQSRFTIGEQLQTCWRAVSKVKTRFWRDGRRN